MYKLLTEEQKKKIQAEYRLRLVVIALWSLIAVIVIGMVSLFPSYILTKARYNELTERLAILEQTGLSFEDKEVQLWLNQMNQKLKLLSPKFDKDRPSVFIEEALRARVAGIRVTSLGWKREANGEIITLTGTASDRQSLINFENKLDKLGNFGDVSLPISNLAKDKDIDFEVELVKAN